MEFADRRSAGRMLAGKLAGLAELGDHRGVTVVGLPRGGVPVAYEVALAFGAPLDVLIVRKLGVPWSPELAMGALASGGIVVENPDVMSGIDGASEVLQSVLSKERAELQRREQRYRRGTAAAPVAGRTVVLVDDGAATGATMLAGVRSLAARGASRIVAAVPVASIEAAERLRAEADTFVALSTPGGFMAVGSFYASFPQVDDQEVIDLLAESKKITVAVSNQ